MADTTKPINPEGKANTTDTITSNDSGWSLLDALGKNVGSLADAFTNKTVNDWQNDKKPEQVADQTPVPSASALSGTQQISKFYETNKYLVWGGAGVVGIGLILLLSRGK